MGKVWKIHGLLVMKSVFHLRLWLKNNPITFLNFIPIFWYKFISVHLSVDVFLKYTYIKDVWVTNLITPLGLMAHAYHIYPNIKTSLMFIDIKIPKILDKFELELVLY